jgi:HPr kinase/phosphorylase
MRWVHVDDLLKGGREALGLKVLGGASGLGRALQSWKVLRPGKSLWAEGKGLRCNRILVLGERELASLAELPAEKRSAALRVVTLWDIPCLVIEGGLSCPQDLLRTASENSVPVLGTPLAGPKLLKTMERLLKELLGSPLYIQGVLLKVFEVGVLLIGKSGIGKSECALDMIDRGHALVADDFVELSLDGQGRVVGRSPELLKDHMEVRGLGILNVSELFGEKAVVSSHTIDLVVELLEWERFSHEDRSGLTRRTFTLLERDLPLVRIPVSLNRNVAILVEVAVKKLMRSQGAEDAPGKFDRKILEAMKGVLQP